MAGRLGLQRVVFLGVRATRLNLVSSGVPNPAGAAVMLGEAARRMAPLGWHVQIFADLPLLAELTPVFRRLPGPTANSGLRRSRIG